MLQGARISELKALQELKQLKELKEHLGKLSYWCLLWSTNPLTMDVKSSVNVERN